jgi:hypothetical protein
MEREASSPEQMVCSFIYIGQECPIRSPPTKIGENIWSPSTEPHADGRPTYNGVRPGSPSGSFTTLQSLLQCHAAFSTIPSILAWVDQSPVSVYRSNPHQAMPSTTVTASHVTQGRVEYESTEPRRTDEGLVLWEAVLG